MSYLLTLHCYYNNAEENTVKTGWSHYGCLIVLYFKEPCLRLWHIMQQLHQLNGVLDLSLFMTTQLLEY